MKRLQSRPAGRFSAHAAHGGGEKKKKVPGDVRLVVFSELVVIPTCAQSHVDTLRWQSGVEGRVPGATYSAERNAIVDNCKQRGAVWTWVGRGGAQTKTHFTHTCPADDGSYAIMSIRRAGFNGI